MCSTLIVVLFILLLYQACDAMFHLCRTFEDPDITHVEGDVSLALFDFLVPIVFHYWNLIVSVFH